MSEFKHYFQVLFSLHCDNINCNLEAVISAIHTRVTKVINNSLLVPYTKEEVKKGIFEMHSEKAPGVDGYSAMFYQKFWSSVKNKVTEVNTFRTNKIKLDTKLNVTKVILIPKKENSVIVEDFRPISLCNVLMKIITKAMSNILNDHLPSIVSHTQSAFTSDTLMTYNIIVAKLKRQPIQRGIEKGDTMDIYR